MKKKLAKKQVGGNTDNKDRYLIKEGKGRLGAKVKGISENRYDRLSDRYNKQEGSKTDSVSTSTGKIERVTSGKRPNKFIISAPSDLKRKGGATKSKKK